MPSVLNPVPVAYRTLVLLLLLALLAAAVVYLYRDNTQVRAEKEAIINLMVPQVPTRTVDPQGRETVRVVTPVVTAAVLKDLKAGLAAEMRDQLRKEFGRSAQLLQGQRVQTQTQQVLPKVALHDTTVYRTSPTGKVVAKAARAGTFKDEWLSLTGVVTDDTLSVKYFIKNDFDIRAYSRKDKKHWFQFWKPRKVYVDLKNKNPNTSTTGIEAVRVEKQ